jgi:HIV Tat-specific factor 1
MASSFVPPFTINVDEFDQDDRISFSKLDNKYIAVHDDGAEFEYDANLRRWLPAEDEPADDASHRDTHYGLGSESSSRSSSSKKRKPGPAFENEVSRLVNPLRLAMSDHPATLTRLGTAD